MSNKRGRPRHPGPREHSGRPLRRVEPTPELLAKRAALAGGVDTSDQAFGTPFGIWHLRGELTEAQYRAGLSLVRLAEALRRQLGGPRPPSALDLDGIAGQSLLPDSATHYARTKARWAETLRLLEGLDAFGHHRRAVLAAARIEEADELALVQAALSELAAKQGQIAQAGREAVEQGRAA